MRRVIIGLVAVVILAGGCPGPCDGTVPPSRRVPSATTTQLTIPDDRLTINHMVVKSAQLDTLFHALSDATRRSILQQLAGGGALVKDLAEPFAMSKQAVSKHLHVLEKAGLVVKKAEGRSTRVRLRPKPLRQVEDWVSFYRGFWARSLVALAEVVDGEEETPE
jgi:DNA-binding transcriptional ArsR family regulator